MKFPAYSFLILMLLLSVFPAGCTQSQSPVSTPVTLSMPTPVAYTNLSELMLSPREMPIAVKGTRTLEPDMGDPVIRQFGGLRGLTQYVIDQTTASETSTQIGQTIVEYPPGNAAKAFDVFVNLTRQADPSMFSVTWLSDPGIGDKSCGFIIVDRSGKQKPLIMIVFVKSGLMESVIMISPTQDAQKISVLARMAAAKIP